MYETLGKNNTDNDLMFISARSLDLSNVNFRAVSSNQALAQVLLRSKTIKYRKC